MNQNLHQILSRVPVLAGRNDLVVTELSGGITNHNYKIEADGLAYVLRLGGNDTGLLGIDRRVEYGCTLAAAQAGIAPEPVAFLEPEGYLVTRFVSGRGLPADVIGTPENIARVMASVKRYHALESFPGSFSPFRVVDAYLPVARDHDAPLPDDIDRFMAWSGEIEAALSRRQLALVPCHNDLLNGNFIDDGAAIRILDWEYGGMGDRFFDLGNFSAQHGFNRDQDECVLREYFGLVTADALARQQLMKIMSDMREAMWAMVQCNVSKIEFDYVGYGMQYFERIRAAAGGGKYQGWLAAAA